MVPCRATWGKAELRAGLSTWIQPYLNEVSHWQVRELGFMQLCWADLNYKYEEKLQCLSLSSTTFPFSFSPEVSLSLPRSLPQLLALLSCQVIGLQ